MKKCMRVGELALSSLDTWAWDACDWTLWIYASINSKLSATFLVGNFEDWFAQIPAPAKKLRSNAPPKNKCLLKEEAKEITQAYEHGNYGAFDQRQEPVEGPQMVLTPSKPHRDLSQIFSRTKKRASIWHVKVGERWKSKVAKCEFDS